MPADSTRRFTILEELGRGAMGVVYRAEDAQMDGAVVALKTIQSQGPVTADQRLAFKEEFRAMARLAHPNLIQVHDYGQLDDETQFLTMEIVTGQDLDALMREGPMPLERAYALLIQLLQALAFIHSRRYVHRDIKPRNIRVTPEGALKLMDFGLMRQLGLAGGDAGLTGSPGYMAPEAIQGGVIGAYSDLYSVGCIAYELVTGAPPFEGTMSEVLRAHMRESAPPMRVPGGRVPARLQRLVAKLLEKDPEARYRQASEVIADLASLAGLSVVRTNLDQKASYLTSDALVGREHELATLRRAREDAAGGRGGAIFVGAPAGVGKSRLAQEFLTGAKLEDAIVLTGACQERGQAPYEAIARAVRPLAAAFKPEAPVAALLDGLPVEKEALKDAITRWLLAAAERRAIVLAVEDLHWCDPQSLEALNHVVRHAHGGRLLIVATFRHDETPPGSPVWYTIEEGAAAHLKLAAFDAAQVLALLKATLRELRLTREFHQFLYDATAGNAFYLIELLRYLMEEGVLTQAEGAWHFPTEPGPIALPRSLEATVTRRLAHLSPAALQLASAAAVMGPRQDLPTLLEVSGLEEEALFAHLDELVERQFIVREDHRYAFPHSRVREALYERLDSEARRALHARCGLALEARGAGVDALAYHFRRGRDMAKAYDYLRRAAAQAERAGADAVALDYLRQAEEVLQGLDRPDKASELAALWWEIGVSAFILSPGAAIAAFEKLLPALEAQGDPEGFLVDALQMLSIAYALLGRPLKGLEVHDRAIALMPDPDTPAYAAVLTARCASLLTGGLYDELKATAERAAALLVGRDLSGLPHPVRMARVGAVAIQNAVAFAGARPDAALRDDALAAAAANGDDSPFTVRQYDGVWAAWTGRHDEATDYVEATLAMGRRVGAPPFIWVLYMRPYMLHQRGEHADALAQLERALRYPHLDEADFTKQLLRVLQGQLHLALGQPALARHTLEDALSRGREARMQLVTIQALLALGQVDAAEGALGTARERYREAHALAAEGPARNPLFEGVALRLLGELAVTEGMHIAARRHLTGAEAIAAAQDNLIEQGRLQLAWGELHLARQDREEALAALGKAERTFQRLKNAHWVHRAAVRLEAARALEPGPRRPFGTRELT